ncbi:hypothetical protein SAMN04488018_1304 [Myroides marinus]|uniref:Uncharacterized protein n=1 Tax=Myroides marinus TaxID=703342 RepID=A0A1H6Y9P4_9FLAO|nr:hypothetical protein SAMN04488018_1304 [Myroides marinus]
MFKYDRSNLVKKQGAVAYFQAEGVLSPFEFNSMLLKVYVSTAHMQRQKYETFLHGATARLLSQANLGLHGAR